MPVTVESTRFGTIAVEDDAVLEFPSGLIGLGGHRFALHASSPGDLIVWLHSLEDPALAVPVTDPWTFFPGYEVVLSDDEAARIGVASPDEARVLVTVRVGRTAQDCFANLKAPILVAGRTGHQVINDAPDLPLRAPLVGETPPA